jgi:hypothetical protein
MMIDSTVTCDRCRNPILESRTLLKVECGPVRAAGVLELDLCSGCAGLLIEWLRASPAKLASAAASMP